MKSLSEPRRVYMRAGAPIICLGGCYFGKTSKGDSEIDAKRTVKTEMLPRKGGKGRIKVVQGKVTENWSEVTVKFAKRS